MSTQTIGYVILEAMDPDYDHEVKITGENGKRAIAEGKLQTAEENNRNGRAYLQEDLHREITCARTMELLQSGQLRGEASHPIDENILRQQTIMIDRCNVKYLKLWMEGNDVLALFQGTNNTLGEAFDADLKDGDKPSFSLRALGILKSTGGRNIVTNVKMITYDNVIYPSHPGAYTTRLVNESTNYAINNNMDRTPITEQYQNTKGILIPITNSQVIDYIKTESTNINSIMNQIDVFYDTIKLEGSKVRLVAKTGDIFYVNLESHIQNEIQKYCAELIGKS